MRESLHYSMIPTIPQDNMNEIIFNGSRRILTNVSSNAYYGYQPQIHVQEKNNSQSPQMASEICDMDIQFNHLPNGEEMQMENGIPRLVNRKRRWEYPDELDEFKKKRQNGKSLHAPSNHQVQTPPIQKAVHLRKPTHNIPDVPRCIMENNNTDNQKKIPKEDKDTATLEDILRETHGVSIYHWFYSKA